MCPCRRPCRLLIDALPATVVRRALPVGEARRVPSTGSLFFELQLEDMRSKAFCPWKLFYARGSCGRLQPIAVNSEKEVWESAAIKFPNRKEVRDALLLADEMRSEKFQVRKGVFV